MSFIDMAIPPSASMHIFTIYIWMTGAGKEGVTPETEGRDAPANTFYRVEHSRMKMMNVISSLQRS